MPRALRSLLFAALLMSGSSSALAQEEPDPSPAESGECDSDADCPDDAYCLQVEEYDCTTAPCPDGEDCEPQEPSCEIYLFGVCVPDWLVECESEADCEDGLECVTFEESYCEGEEVAPCDPDDPAGCPEPEEPECFVESYSYCMPSYLAPCEEDLDCGEGFECRLDEICQCSDSSPDPDGEAEPGEECTCETSDIGWCEPILEACETDSDCLEGWTCEDRQGELDEVTCTTDEEGNEVCESQDPGSEGLVCVPPYWNDIPGGSAEPIYEDGNQDVEGGDSEPDEGDDLDDGDAEDLDEAVPEDEGSLFGCSAGSSSGYPAAALLLMLAFGLVACRRTVR